MYNSAGYRSVFTIIKRVMNIYRRARVLGIQRGGVRSACAIRAFSVAGRDGSVRFAGVFARMRGYNSSAREREETEIESVTPVL